MTTTNNGQAAARDEAGPIGESRLGEAQVRRAFTATKALVVTYGVLSAAVLGTVALVAAFGHATCTFEWIRSSIILASAVLIYWLAAAAARGSRSAYERVRAISIIVPVAIVVVDLIPGVAPLWFTLEQTACALALGAAAGVLRGRRVRAAFAGRG
ncbi:hypothetical protein ACFT2C_07825 [Promicromonospora sp. NPDC057138]|uniref:hypothetical protein n=1 Tax=Promicromonospora sp. NPDC057138 TaxID=3346031 RepID=UPI003634D2FB